MVDKFVEIVKTETINENSKKNTQWTDISK